MVGWLRGFAFAFAAAGPAAFSAGAAFALVAAAAGKAKVVYVAEAAGSCVAGLLFTTILYRWFTPLTAGVLVLACAAGAAAVAKARGARVAAAVILLLTLAAASVVVKFRAPLLERCFFARSFPGEQVLDYRSSPYGAVVAARRVDQYSLYENGLLVASYPDGLAAEETVQPAIAHWPQPRSAAMRALCSPSGRSRARVTVSVSPAGS